LQKLFFSQSFCEYVSWLFCRRNLDDFDHLHFFGKLLYLLEVDGEVFNLGMVQWVLSNFDVACVVAMYGMIDTLVMLSSTNKSKKPLSFFCSFHECYKFGQQGHILLFLVKLHVIEVPLNENK